MSLSISLSTPIGHEADTTIEDIVSSEASVQDDGLEGIVRDEVHGRVASVLSGQDERLINIVWLRYGLDGGEPMTYTDIGKRFGLTSERIRQLEKQALTELRKHSSEFEGIL